MNSSNHCGSALQHCIAALRCDIPFQHFSATLYCSIVLHCMALHFMALHCIHILIGSCNWSQVTRLRSLIRTQIREASAGEATNRPEAEANIIFGVDFIHLVVFVFVLANYCEARRGRYFLTR